MHPVLQSDCSSSVVSNDSFRFARGSTGVENVQRMQRIDNDWAGFDSYIFNLYKVMFVGSQGLWVKQIASLMDYFGHFGLLAQLQCVINQLFIVNYPGRLFSGVGANDQLRLTIFDTVGQLIR